MHARSIFNPMKVHLKKNDLGIINWFFYCFWDWDDAMFIFRCKMYNMQFYCSWEEIQCKQQAVMEFVLPFLEIQTVLSKNWISRYLSSNIDTRFELSICNDLIQTHKAYVPKITEWYSSVSLIFDGLNFHRFCFMDK